MAKLVMNINMIRTGGGRGSRYGVDDLALQDRASLWAARNPVHERGYIHSSVDHNSSKTVTFRVQGSPGGGTPPF